MANKDKVTVLTTGVVITHKANGELKSVTTPYDDEETHTHPTIDTAISKMRFGFLENLYN